MQASIDTTTSAARRTLHLGNAAGDSGKEQTSVRGSLMQANEVKRDSTQNLDRALACFSIGLGLVEVLAPRWLGRAIGAGEHPTLMRLCGVREIASGLALLSPRIAAEAAGSRLAGDAMDMALLSTALATPDSKPGRLRLAAAAVLGVAAADAYAVSRHARNGLLGAAKPQTVSASIAINSTPAKLYAFWRDVENLPRFMTHLESVTKLNDRTSSWVVKGPAGSHVRWKSEIIEDLVNERIGWHTLPEADLQHEGHVTFASAPADRGCIVHVEMMYAPPAGSLGVSVARILGEEPQQQIQRDLRALKQILETGEVATTRGQAAGRRSVLGKTLTRREP